MIKNWIKTWGRKSPALWNSMFLCMCLLRIGKKKVKNFVFYHLSVRRIQALYEEKYYNKMVGILPTDHAFGPLLLWTEITARKSRALGFDLKKDVVFVIQEENPYVEYIDLMNKNINLVKDSVFYNLAVKNNGLSWLRKQKKIVSPYHLRDGLVYFTEAPPILTFSDEENERGFALLQDLNIQKGDRVVTVHNKDPFFYNSTSNQDKHWDRYRDSEFLTLLPTINLLKSLNYKVVRMGHYQEEDNRPYLSTNIIKNQSDRRFIDFFLQQQALFSICGSSGIGCIPYQLKKPLLIHNYIPLGLNISIDHGIFLPKLIRHKKTKTLMPLSELQKLKSWVSITDHYFSDLMIYTGDMFHIQDHYDLYELEIVDNSAEEIQQAVQEMLEFTTGNFKLTPTQAEQQKKFKNLFPVTHNMHLTQGIVSPYFLNKYEQVLCN